MDAGIPMQRNGVMTRERAWVSGPAAGAATGASAQAQAQALKLKAGWRWVMSAGPVLRRTAESAASQARQLGGRCGIRLVPPRIAGRRRPRGRVGLRISASRIEREQIFSAHCGYTTAGMYPGQHGDAGYPN